MTPKFRFSICLLLAITVPAIAPAQQQSGVAILLAKARSLEARGRIDLAADNWRRVLLAEPNQKEALAGLARTAKENGHPGKETYYLNRLRKIDPHDPEIAAVENLRVLTATQRSRLDEAGRLAMEHKPDQAMTIYREVLGDQPPPLGKWAGPYYETEAESTGGRAKAIAQLRELCAEHPQQQAYQLWLASLLTYAPATRMQGFQLFESIKDPGFAQQARAPWRRALLWEKDNPQALGPIEAYLQRYPDPQLQAAASALRAKQEMIATGKDQQQGFKELRAKHLGAAAAEFNAVLSRSPNDADALIGLGYVRLDQKQFNEAFTLFQKARKLAPNRQDAQDGYNNAEFWMTMQRGTDAQRENQPAAAMAAFQQALTLRPLDNGALLGLANALVKERKFSRAGAKFQQVLNQDPSNVDALAGLGFVRLNQGNFNDAQRLFARVRQLDPNRKDVDRGYQNARFWGVMHQADAALHQNQLQAAVADYKRATLLSPNNQDALAGLARAQMRAGDYPGAAKAYGQLIAAYPSQPSNWLGLIRAQADEDTPQVAIATAQSLPPAIRQKLESSSEFPSEMALVYFKANQTRDSEQAVQRALQLSLNSDTPQALAFRLQLAGELMKHGNSGQAIEIYIQATHSHPEDANTWQALIGAYVRQSDFIDAAGAVRSMPQQAYQAAEEHPSFLNAVALLYSARGQCSRAEDFLQRSFALAQSAGHMPSESAQLQQADIWMRERSYSQARDLYHEVITRDSNSTEAWRGYLVALHLEHADRTLVAEIPRMRESLRARLEADPNFLILEASAYSTAGRNRAALPLLQEARARYTAQSRPAPLSLEIQTAWTMLAISPNEPGLGPLLRDAKSRAGLAAEQRRAIEELWSVWSVRRAELAFASKPQLAYSILAAAGRVFPTNRDIHIALASLYLKQNDKGKALEVFRAWNMAGACAADYRMAAGTALAAHKDQLADRFMQRGLIFFPHDPGLLHMSARREIARGNYREAEHELHSALQSLQQQSSAAPETRALLALNQREDAATAAIARNSSGTSPNSFNSNPPCKAELGGEPAQRGRIRPVSLTFIVPRAQTTAAQQGATQQQPSPQVRAQQQTEEEQIEEEAEAVKNRNTPIITVGGVGTGRVGDAGIDRLVIGDSVLRASYTVSNSLRLSVEGHGVYAYSGTPDGSSNLPFGTLPAYALFGEQSKIGSGGQFQLSSNTFGLAFGMSPQGFAVHNWIGGIRFRPLNGWLTFLGERNSVKDSLLSYAGSRDPGTGIRWGGVVANTGTVKFDSAPATGSVYKRFGEYGSGSYSFIQGLHVPNNWSASGNAGFYWQMVPGFTMGVNATAMHYNRNLSYFSFGQGGYFSPQQYYLASIPIAWYSRHPRFEYQIKFSGGMQYLHEDSSPLYPVLPGSFPVTQGFYASNSTTAPNYDLDIRFGYRVTPHLYFDTFATANNAQNYYQQSAGFHLKFTFDRIPTHMDIPIRSIPDWRGKQPLTIR